jgi:hypothetical protein
MFICPKQTFKEIIQVHVALNIKNTLYTLAFRYNAAFISILLLFSFHLGARGSVVGWGTMLQAWR